MKKYEKKKIQKRSTKGITLIALVITIIVLLILAGVTLAAISGEDGILKKAVHAKEETEKATAREKVEIAVLASYGTKAGLDDELLIGNLEVIQGIDTSTIPETAPITYPLTVKVDGYQFTISSQGKTTEENSSVTTDKTVNDLKVGDKVYYIDKNDVKRECVVLYDSSSGYGVQVITADAVENKVEFEDTIEDYNNALKILYDEAQKYLNATYATSARCVGSDPADPDWDVFTNEAGYYTKNEDEEDYHEGLKDYYGTVKDRDSKAFIDGIQIQKISGKLYGAETHVFASREFSINDTAAHFSVRTGGIEGEFYIIPSITVIGKYRVKYIGESYYFRPIFTLRPELKITDGDGADTPYTLEP